jgi:hypothetical protein
MSTCKTCKFRNINKECTNNKFVEDADYENEFNNNKTNDRLVYPYEEGGYFRVEDNFGCIHYSKRLDKNFTKVKDIEVINIWIKSEDDDCEYNIEPVEINPDWYQENGTPICSCGQDLVYSHTEVFI